MGNAQIAMAYLRTTTLYRGAMSHPLATFDPDDIHDSKTDAGLPPWARLLVDQVRQAAASGQTVTVSAEERMLTPAEVRRRLNLHRSTVVRRILAVEIRAVKVGNRHRIPYSEFQRFRDSVLDTLARASASEVEAELFGDQ